MTEPRLPRQRRPAGAAEVTAMRAPRTRPRPPDLQGTLALDLHPSVPAPQRRTLTASADRPEDLERFTKRFCAALVEVVAGDRGPAQLLRFVAPAVYDELVRRGRALARVAGPDERLRRPRARIRSVRVFCPAPDVAEFSIHVQHGRRSRAVAGRLEWLDGEWICVALEFG